MKLFDYFQKALSLQFDMMNASLGHASKYVAEVERIAKRAVEV